jgi:hypothetical protein
MCIRAAHDLALQPPDWRLMTWRQLTWRRPTSTSSLSWKSHSITAGDVADFSAMRMMSFFHGDNLVWSDEISYTLITSENVKQFTRKPF